MKGPLLTFLLLAPAAALVPPSRFCKSRASSVVLSASHDGAATVKPSVSRRDALSLAFIGAAAAVMRDAEPALALQDLDNVGDLGNAILKAQPKAAEPEAPAAAPKSGGGGGAATAPAPYTGKKKMKWQIEADLAAGKVQKVEGQEDNAIMMAKQKRQEKREAQEKKTAERKRNCTYIEKMNQTGGC